MKFAAGLIIGVMLFVGVTKLHHPAAAMYSRWIYDCGVRIAKDARLDGGSVVSVGHDYGFCRD